MPELPDLAVYIDRHGMIVAVDQATKAMVRAAVPVHDSVTIIPGFLDITHALNSGQRYAVLTCTAKPTKLVLTAPEGPTDLPPGPYMLFLLTEDGVPSRAHMVTLQSPPSAEPSRDSIIIARVIITAPADSRSSV